MGEIQFPYERIEAALTEQVAARIEDVGFAVIGEFDSFEVHNLEDNVFGTEWCNALRQEIKLLYDRNLLYSNKTYYEGRKEEGKFKFSYAISKVFQIDFVFVSQAHSNLILVEIHSQMFMS